MPRWGQNLGARLLVSYLLVAGVGVLTVFVAASLTAPAFFAGHMARMRHDMGGMMGGADPAVMDPAFADAFREALTQALVLAAGVAVPVALLVSLVVTRQIARPVQRLAQATRRIAAGHYAERVPVPDGTANDVLPQLAASFNAMAGSLERTERRRLELIGDVSHELRTPIATLEGYLEGLLDGVIEPSPLIWGRLHDEAGRLRRLVDDLQELSRAEAGQFSLQLQPTAPVTIVAASLERLRGQFEEKGLDLMSDLPGDLPPVLVDPDRAIQALTNLLTNALRYTPAPGQVVVRAERQGEQVAIRVRDTGIGFEPARAGHLFERFYRADKSRSRALGGSGIGLTIARALVEAMGGRIQAESPGPGQGSTFTVLLPIVH